VRDTKGRVIIFEDPKKFGPGMVVIKDGVERRLLITKIVVGFAECLWFGKHGRPHTEIVNVNELTMAADQKWVSTHEQE